jgi:hypothetical protein
MGNSQVLKDTPFSQEHDKSYQKRKAGSNLEKVKAIEAERIAAGWVWQKTENAAGKITSRLINPQHDI